MAKKPKKLKRITVTLNLSRLRAEMSIPHSNGLKYRRVVKEAEAQAVRAVRRYLRREFDRWHRGIPSDLSSAHQKG